MKVIFSATAIKQYMDWQSEDKKTLKRINELIKEIFRLLRHGLRYGNNRNFLAGILSRLNEVILTKGKYLMPDNVERRVDVW
jgi:hypothetical protein